MVANTVMKTLTNAWEQVSVDGLTECSITLEGTRGLQAVVRIARDQPAAGESEGVRLTHLHPGLPITGLASGQRVWARAVDGQARISIH